MLAFKDVNGKVWEIIEHESVDGSSDEEGEEDEEDDEEVSEEEKEEEVRDL